MDDEGWPLDSTKGRTRGRRFGSRTTTPDPGSTVPAPAPPAGEPAPAGADRVLDGRYRLVERLGQGGMGTVWKARDETLERDVAVKEPRLPDGVPADVQEQLFTRMEREARAAARVTHPSVVAIHDVLPVDGRPWIVMELVPGETLADVLAEGTLPVAEAARIGSAVLGALEAVHAEGVLHRDVKPGNILLGPAGRVVLTDFGIARIEGDTPLTRTGFVGTPDYMAPERVRGLAPGPASDLFSLGAVLYRATEGVTPFHRDLPQLTMQAVLDSEPARPVQAGAQLGGLILGLLAKEPTRRPSVREAAEVLDEVSATLVTPASAPVPAPSPAREQEPASSGTGSVVVRPRRGLRVRRFLGVLLLGGILGTFGGGYAVLTAGWYKSPEELDVKVPDSWRWKAMDGALVGLPPGFEEEQDYRKEQLPRKAHLFAGDQNRKVYVGEQPETVDGMAVPRDSAGETAEWYRKRLGGPGRKAREVSVEERSVNGADVALLTATYKNDRGGWWRKREMYYNEDGERWTIVLDSAVTQNETELAEEAQDFEILIHSFEARV